MPTASSTDFIRAPTGIHGVTPLVPVTLSSSSFVAQTQHPDAAAHALRHPLCLKPRLIPAHQRPLIHKQAPHVVPPLFARVRRLPTNPMRLLQDVQHLSLESLRAAAPDIHLPCHARMLASPAGLSESAETL